MNLDNTRARNVQETRSRMGKCSGMGKARKKKNECVGGFAVLARVDKGSGLAATHMKHDSDVTGSVTVSSAGRPGSTPTLSV